MTLYKVTQAGTNKLIYKGTDRTEATRAAMRCMRHGNIAKLVEQQKDTRQSNFDRFLEKADMPQEIL